MSEEIQRIKPGFEADRFKAEFLTDMNHFADMNAVYAEFFSEPYPARSAVAVKTLPKGALVEIEVVAAV